MIELSKDEKKELKEFVEGKGFDLFNEQEVAKEGLNDLSKGMADEIGLKVGDIKKMVKFYYKSKMDEEKEKFEEFETLYREVLES